MIQVVFLYSDLLHPRVAIDIRLVSFGLTNLVH